MTLALQLILTIALTVVLADATLMCGGTLNRIIFPAAWLIAVAGTFFLSTSPRAWLHHSLGATAVIIATCAVAALVSDPSWDGNFYHQEIAARLQGAWNPYLMSDAEAKAFDPDTSLWAMHYAKGIETAAACIIALTGNIESGKAVNWMLVIACVAPVWMWVRRCFGNVSPRVRAAVTVATVLCPVSILQIFTYYVDYAQYCYILLAIAGGAMFTDGIDRSTRLQGTILVAAAIILAVATKFTAFFFTGLCCALIIIRLLALQRFRPAFRLSVLCAGAAVAGVLISYHPYITNLTDYGNPFYPLLGQGSADIMTGNTPAEYSGHNRVTNFIISNFSFNLKTLYDSRMGGFGAMFGLILAASLAAVFALRYPHKRTAVYVTLCALLSCFIFSQAWWARYVSQAWLTVPAACYAIAACRSRRRTVFGSVFGILVGLNLLQCIATSVAFAGHQALQRHTILNVLRDNSLPAANIKPQDVMRLQGYGITVVPVPADTTYTRPGVLLYGRTDYVHDVGPYSMPVIYADTSGLRRISTRLDRLHLNQNLFFPL